MSFSIDPFPLFVEIPGEQTAIVQDNQKAVTNWYSQNPSNNAPDVYLPEWTERFLHWYQASLEATITRVSEITTHGTLKELDLDRGSFTDDPIAAVALWGVLQASYHLDSVVCRIPNSDSAKVVEEWKAMKPFEYFDSPRVERRWRKSLDSWQVQLKSEKSEDQDAILRRMCEMRLGIDALEDSWRELEASFAVNLDGYESKDLMLQQIRRAIAWRFSALDNALREDENDTKARSETAGEPGELAAESDGDVIFRRIRRQNSLRDYVLSLHFDWRSISAESALAVVFVLILLLSCLWWVKQNNH